MAGKKIQCNYDDFASIASDFAKESDETQKLIETVRNTFDQLEGGDWIGNGAKAFFEEMKDLVFPAMDRLKKVLGDASSAAKRIADVFQNAEDEAGALFR